MNRKAYWDEVYRRTPATRVSWYQAEAATSLRLIQRVAPDRSAAIIDVGAGESVLADNLVAAGYHNLTILDVSTEALAHTRACPSLVDARVRWVEADVLAAELPAAGYDVWHDRAVFHFLTARADRERYVSQVRASIRPGGHVIVSTFAPDGPSRCSGLDVERYAPDSLHSEFGSGFEIVAHEREEHITPAGATQAFVYCVCRVRPALSGVRAERAVTL